MRIAFIVPSLKFGVNAIADYTFRLGCRCGELGHESILVSPRARQAMTVPSGDVDSWSSFLAGFSPHLVSWQFDPEIFTAARSRIFWRASDVPFQGHVRPLVHVMMHETWDGLFLGASFRRRVKGLAQRVGILGWLRRLAPHRIHTSNALYRWQLAKAGFSATILPHFGTIPINWKVHPETDYQAKEWRFVIFGPLFGDWDPRPLAGILATLPKRTVLHYVGRQSGSPVWRRLQELAPTTKFVDHGPLAEEGVSQVLLQSHFAVTTYPRVLLGKSSTYASYRDHGLSTIVTRYDIRYRGFGDSEPQEDVLELGDLPERLFRTERRPIVDTAPLVAARFLKEGAEDTTAKEHKKG